MFFQNVTHSLPIRYMIFVGTRHAVSALLNILSIGIHWQSWHKIDFAIAAFAAIFAVLSPPTLTTVSAKPPFRDDIDDNCPYGTTAAHCRHKTASESAAFAENAAISANCSL